MNDVGHQDRWIRHTIIFYTKLMINQHDDVVTLLDGLSLQGVLMQRRKCLCTSFGYVRTPRQSDLFKSRSKSRWSVDHHDEEQEQ